MKEVEEEMRYMGGGVCRPIPITIEDMILRYLKHRPLNRTQLSLLTNIPRTTLYDHLVKLILQDKVEKFSSRKRKRGRPLVYYRLI